MSDSEPPRPTVTRWIGRMPDALSTVLLIGAIGSALAVHDRVSDLEREMATLRIEQRVTQEAVNDIRRAVVGTLANR
jgi:hypothetical protein